jgi:hypothetical protein
MEEGRVEVRFHTFVTSACSRSGVTPVLCLKNIPPYLSDSAGKWAAPTSGIGLYYFIYTIYISLHIIHIYYAE